MRRYNYGREDRFWEEFQNLQSQMNRIFSTSNGATMQFPPVNVWADSEKCELEAELPGVKVDDLSIEVKGPYLTIEGQRNAPDIDDEQSVIHRQERIFGRFIRSITLPFDIEPNAVSAEMKNGVLHIDLPRAEASKPQKILIKAHE
ncbi:MAG: Hsp20/alpha crystallin family protein [Spartobacteria bacterium]|nr:Hsp20/alpha crystallin family protein [Spartobacteria bacterium]